MNSSPDKWTTTIARAALTLLFVAVVALVVWNLLRPLLPLLIVLMVLIGVLRLALSWFRRDNW